MMKAVCNRPGLYVGSASMPQVRAFLDGYAMALTETGQLPDYPFGGFLRWLERKHCICHPAWGWDRILVHAAGSDSEAIRTLPERFEQYRAELSSGSFDPEHTKSTIRQPEQTCTERYNER